MRPSSFKRILFGTLLFLLPVPAAPAQEMIPSPNSAATDQPVETVFLPKNDLFKPLLADLKEPRFYVSIRRYSYRKDNISVIAGGYGEIFGLYRHTDRVRGTAWQADFGGGIHSQFNLDAYSFALVNTDYTVGFPFTYRHGPDSFRAALYHQSSHLGDEYLLQTKTNRLELSYEAINFIASHEWTEWRVYGGGEYLIHKVPADLKPLGLQAGVEYYGVQPMIGSGRPIGGIDLKSDEEHHWALNASVKAGLQFDSSEQNGRYIRVLLEGYKGYAPHGQFYIDRIGFYGLGVALGFD